MKVSANDFQSWRAFEVEVEGLTVIVGPSNIGKSAVFRAVRGICRNEIEAGHIRKGADETKISVEFEGNTATVARNAKGTSYTVNGEDFGKLAGDIPSSMATWGFQPVEVGAASIDPVFASQFDAPFLLTSTPAERNAVFGAFSSTEKLDAGRKEIKAEITALDSEAKTLGAEIERKLTEFGSLKDTLETISTYEEGITEEQGRMSSLASAEAVLDVAIPTVSSLEGIHAALDHLDLPDPQAPKTLYRAEALLETVLGTLDRIAVAKVAQKVVSNAATHTAAGSKCSAALTQIRAFQAAKTKLVRVEAQRLSVQTAWDAATKANRLGKALERLETLQENPSIDIAAIQAAAVAPVAQADRITVLRKALTRLTTLVGIKLPRTATITKAHKAVEDGKAKVETTARAASALLKAAAAAKALAPLQKDIYGLEKDHCDLEVEIEQTRQAIREQSIECPKCGTLILARTHNGC